VHSNLIQLGVANSLFTVRLTYRQRHRDIWLRFTITANVVVRNESHQQLLWTLTLFSIFTGQAWWIEGT